MKKLLTFFSALLVFVLMATALVACDPPDNGGGGGGGDTIDNAWWNTSGELTMDGDKVMFSDVTINMTTIVTGADTAALESIVAQFNAQYRNKININMTKVNQAEYETTVSQQIANKSNPPDLLMCHQKFLKSFADNKLLQPFNETLEKSKIDLALGNYSTSLAQYGGMGYTDYTFGIPADAQSCVVLVNKKLLNDYADGVLPTNHADLIELGKKVAMGTGKPAVAWTTEDDFFSNYVFNTALLQNGAELYNSTNYRAEWYSDETNRTAFKNAIQSLRDFTTSQPAVAKFGQTEGESYSSFYKNEALFLVCMPWNVNDIIAEYANQNSITVDVAKTDKIGATGLAGWFALDANSANANAIFGDSHFFAMSTTVTSITTKAAICEFIRWFSTNVEMAIKWGEVGHISASNVINANPDYSADATIANFTKKFYGDINNFHCIGVTPYNKDVSAQLSSLFAKVKTNQGTDDANIKTAQDAVNAVVDFFG